ncbi:MAG TPA: heavy metal translocating P-type ATPase [Candidatus Kapabacteria bacterium]|nr:heavy metal translocating P-type ATPase [Candidatus Kapabacteria bacterium]
MEQIPQSFPIKGMHCASCANIIQRKIKKIEGVSSVEVNYGTETAKVAFDNAKTNPRHLSKAIEPLGYTLVTEQAEDHSRHAGMNQSKQDKQMEIANFRKKVLSLIPLAIISVCTMSWDIAAQFGIVPEMLTVWKEFVHHLLPIFATYALFVAGTPYLLGVYRFLRYGKANMDTLIGIGTLTAFLYSFVISAFEEALRPFLNTEHTYYDVTIVVIAFITLGKYLEARSKLKTGDAIEKLLNLQAKTALAIRDGQEVEVSIDTVHHGETLIVKPGTKVPVDGVILEGSSFVDEAMVTGEPIPAEKNVGDSVIAGTINTTGTFTFKVTKVGTETLLSSIIRMVEEAQGTKAPIQALADRISGIFVPIVIVLAFVALGVWLLLGTGVFGFSQALSYGLTSFVGILVIACPCALGLATPTAIIVGVGKGANEGILVKDAATLEKLHKVTTVVVDKTGTITKGKPELVSLKQMADTTEETVVSILASLESRSEHPIAQAIVSHAKEQGVDILQAEKFESIKGKGVMGILDGVEYFAGNVKLVEDLHLSFNKKEIEQDTAQGKTPIILATKEKVLGVAMVADAVKLEAKEAVQKLHALGMKVLMVTGDDRNTARFIAKEVGIDEVVAEVLPQDKLTKIQELQKKGEVVAMAGDGVNDAPALAQADVGIAMATGTDVAIESAGITLLHGDISKLVKAIHLSKLTMRGIKQNLFWAFIYNIIGIPLAAGAFYPVFGWLLNPVFAGAAMAFSSVSVVFNSLRIKRMRL